MVQAEFHRTVRRSVSFFAQEGPKTSLFSVQGSVVFRDRQSNALTFPLPSSMWLEKLPDQMRCHKGVVEEGGGDLFVKVVSRTQVSVESNVTGYFTVFLKKARLSQSCSSRSHCSRDLIPKLLKGDIVFISE